MFFRKVVGKIERWCSSFHRDRDVSFVHFSQRRDVQLLLPCLGHFFPSWVSDCSAKWAMWSPNLGKGSSKCKPPPPPTTDTAGGWWVDGWMGGWVDGWMGGWVVLIMVVVLPSPYSLKKKSQKNPLPVHWLVSETSSPDFTGILTFFQLRVPEPLPFFFRLFLNQA